MPGLNDFASDHYIFARDAKSQLAPSATQKTTLIVAGCYIIAIAILWYARTAVLLYRRILTVL